MISRPVTASVGTGRFSAIGGAFMALAPLILLSFVFSAIPFALAKCECGYTLDLEDEAGRLVGDVVFTDLLESNFEKMTSISIGKNTDWQRQEYNVTAKDARGPFGKLMDAKNVELVPAEDEPDKRVLRLTAGSSLVDGMVPGAEIASTRTDITHGSFRASIKVSDVPGTCQAFFWYFNDTQEIDMEFLVKDFDNRNNSWPVNLVLQSLESAKVGHDASKTGNFFRVYLPYNPTEKFHEYRIDYLENRVSFYMDGIHLKHMYGPASIPTSAGHLVLQHWTNGDRMWSGGPPQKEAAMLVRWVKAYFNSADPQITRRRKEYCDSTIAKSTTRNPTLENSGPRVPYPFTCPIKQDNQGDGEFFTEMPDHAQEQTFFGNEASGVRAWGWPLMLSLAGLWVCAL